MKTAIVTCVSESWLAPACVTLLSVSRNLAGVAVDFHIVVDGLSAQSRAHVNEFALRYKIKINLTTHTPEGFSNLNSHRYSQATFLRLCLPQIFSQKYQRLLYLDSDVLALADLSPLLKIDLGGKTLAAVPEIKMAHRRGVMTDYHRRVIGLPKSADYFNAGVLFFDWQKICAEHLLEKARDLLLTGKYFKHLDQDVLNLTAQGQWLALPLKYNVDQSAASYLNIAPALRHFNHAAKPWDWPRFMAYGPHHAYYQEVLKGLALSQFLTQPKRGNPLQASLEFYFRKASLHQRFLLSRRYAHLL